MDVVSGPAVPCGSCGRPLAGEEDGVVRCPCGTVQQVWRFQPSRMSEVLPAPCIDGADLACAYHGGNRAEVPCVRCGSFLCALCATPVGGLTRCPGCFDRLRAADELPELRARVERPHLGAALVSVFALLPFALVVAGPIAAWLAWRAVRARGALRVREPRWWAHLVAAGLLLSLGAAGSGLVVRELVRARAAAARTPGGAPGGAP
jgi:hypothetical protein